MNAIILLATTLFLGAFSGLEIPQGQLVKTWDWRDLRKPISYPTHDGEVVSISCEKATGTGEIALRVSLTGTKSTNGLELDYAVAAMYPIDLEKLPAGSYAILGDVKTENLSTGDSVVLWNRFAQGSPESLRAMDAAGQDFNLDPHHDWQPFWIPFDTKEVKPVSLSVEIYFYGPSTVYFRNMKLVRYSDAPSTQPADPINQPQLVGNLDSKALSDAYLKAQAEMSDLKQTRDAFTSSGYSQDHPLVVAANAQIQQHQALLDTLQNELNHQNKKLPGIDWKSFVLGIAFTALALLALSGFSFFFRRWQRKHNERELRRIASLDG